MKALWFAGLLACVAAPVLAQDDGAAASEDVAAAMQRFVESLDFKTGTVALAGADATLELDGNFRFLESADARRVLEQLWGNPPDESVLGMLVPTAAGLGEPHSWAVVVTHSEDGHVPDMEAGSIDYAELLEEMQASTLAVNDARAEAGYETIQLVGWAAPPRYDATSKKLYWAKRLKFGTVEGETLNYDVRVLGRTGYLSMNAVADMADLPAVETGMQQVLGMTEFDAGARYADFDANTDKVAGYGLAALIGGVAAGKLGLFAKLGALLLAAKKLVIPILIGLVALGSRLFRKKGEAPAK